MLLYTFDVIRYYLSGIARPVNLFDKWHCFCTQIYSTKVWLLHPAFKCFQFCVLYLALAYLFAGMNAAVRAVVRMGMFLGCKVYLIKEV
jgi:hypothetical protein